MKISAAIVISMAAVCLSACGMSKYVGNIKEKASYSINEYQKKRNKDDLQVIVMNAIVDKDVGPIYEKLCPRLKRQKDIKKQLKELIDSFGSDIVKWQMTSKEVMSKSVSKGELEEEYDAWQLHNIKTENGQEYILEICVYSANVNEPDAVGIYALQVLTEGSSIDQKVVYCISGPFDD